MTQPKQPPPDNSARAVAEFHKGADKDSSRDSLHHTLGTSTSQASPGDHIHDGRESRTLDDYLRLSQPAPTVTGSRGGNIALANLLAELESQGIINDGTTA